MYPSTSSLTSVIIPVYNGERFLADALNSVLSQAAGPLEVIVVDDGSTDHSAAVAESFTAVRVIRQPNQGIGGARNTGIAAAQGDFFAFLDADDLWLPGKLARQHACLAQDAALDMVFTHVRQFREDGESVADEVFAGLVADTLLIRRAAFDRAGPFALHWRIGEFLDWYARAMDAGLRGVMLPEVCVLRRMHDDNIGIRERAQRGDYVRVVKAALDRRRAAQ